jgi:N-acetylglucosamine kinase-like BadF-type ATPase
MPNVGQRVMNVDSLVTRAAARRASRTSTATARASPSAALLGVGVDAGGTRVRILALDGAGRARRADLAAVDPARLPGLLRGAWKAWRVRPSGIGALVLASRGVWTDAERVRAAQCLRTVARRVYVMSDAEAAYEGALGGGAGLLVLAGTGSIVIGRAPSGRWGRAGGLGPLLGDEGSAFWIGREWLRATTHGEDFAPARAIVQGPAPVARIAALAPRVLARARGGDPVAGRIVREAQRHLARLAGDAARGLALRRPIRMSWAGSLLVRDAWFRAGLMRAVAREHGRARWIPPVEPPVRAAARLARARLARA